MDSANRSFFALVGAVLVPYVLLGMFGCGVLSLAAYRVADNGWSGLDRGGQDLRLAVAFFAVVTAGTVVALLSIRRQLRATRTLAATLASRRLPSPAPVTEAAARAGLAGQVDVVDDAEPFSFTYGVISPRVVVSRALVAALDPDALEAVLHHERYHVRNRDTLKVVVARAACRAFFFLPALGHLQGRYLAGRELAADRRAVREVGRRPLVRALDHVLEQPSWPALGAAATLGGSEFLELRVDQLETGTEPPLARVPRWSWALTVVTLGVLSAGFVATVAGTVSVSMMGDSAGTGSTLWGVLGGVACMAGWIALAVVMGRHVFGHEPLTLRPPGSTNRS